MVLRLPLLLRAVGLVLASTSLEVRSGLLRFEGVREWDSISLLGIEHPTIGLKPFGFDHGYPIRDPSYWMRNAARPLVREASWACLSIALNECMSS